MTADRSLRLLVVCTANICRSPIAHALLRDRAHRRGVALEIRSAGLSARPRKVDPAVVEVLGERVLAPVRSASQPLDHETVEWADLIVTMTGQQAIEVGSQFRTALFRTFVFDHLVQIATPIEDADLSSWLAAIRKSPRRYPIHPGVADVEDPFGAPVQAFRTVAGRLEELSEQLLDRIFGIEPQQS